MKAAVTPAATRNAPHQRIVVVGQHAFGVRADAARAGFWSRVSAGLWEPQTFRVIERFLGPSDSFIDIGAWIGPTALFGARLARVTYAFEPDPVAFEELSANVRANPSIEPRVRLMPCGVAAQSGTAPLYAGGLYWSEDSSFGDSMSGMLGASRTGQQVHTIRTVALHEFMDLHGVRDCRLVKMDIEGGEYGVIAGGWKRLEPFGMPALYVSFHAPQPQLRESLITSCLEELQRCYRFFLAGATLESVQPLAEASAVRDWADEDERSPWSKLERLLGQGLLASNRSW